MLAAFREPRLKPAGARKRENPALPDDAAQQRMRFGSLSVFSVAKLPKWQSSLASEARRLVRSLPSGRPVDVVREFAGPLCLTAAEMVTGGDPSRRESLVALANEVSLAAAEPLDDDLRMRASAANAELERHFEGAAAPMLAAAFVALTRTLACLLANGWLALIRHPAQLAHLRTRPHLVPAAVEEMLRFAGIPQSVFRRASQDTDLGSCGIRAGQRVILMLASANRDPERFASSERFDCERRASAQVSLGAGPHSCVGAPLIRMAAAAATGAFVDAFAESEVCGPVVWVGGSGFRSPESVYLTQTAMAHPPFRLL